MGDLATRSGSVTYKGYGLRIDPNNVLAMPIVSGDYATTSLSSEGASQNSASGITLIAAVQTRYNNRFVLSGSLEFFSDAFYAENPDNKVLGDQLSLCRPSLLSVSNAGFCKLAGYLRVQNVEHAKYIRAENRIEPTHELLVQEVQQPNLPTSQCVSTFPLIGSYGRPEVAGNNVVYHVKDELWYSVNVQEWDGTEWKPYKVGMNE